ncbi:MAG TPA: YiiX/YebB-like N1pC/P60 family cysteine hydrolase [Rubrivivax sp.]|nr:YiiX/YebB-like N1pC/P60 family cysteine hydrolase [Rubrivivax sp.]
MARALSKAAIRELAVVPYEQVRDLLRTGDLVFCSGSYLFSSLIQRFTRSVWSHVGIVYRDDALGRVFVLESEAGIGVRLVPVSKYLRDYHGRRRPYKGQIVVARMDPVVDEGRLRQCISFGMDELTRPYDNGEILRIAWRILFRRTRPARDRKYICSELVHECYRRAGLRLRVGDGYVSPQDLWCDDAVLPLQRVL